MVFMVVRQARRKKRYLGTRTRGAGDTKNRRGAGSRGGRGKAGHFGHHWIKFREEEGKVSQKAQTRDIAISLLMLNDYVDNLVETSEIKKSDLEKGVEIDFAENKKLKKYTKIIGRTEPKYKFIFKNVKSTENVKKMVESKGGKIE
jgi:large subunit ribosomal protein L15